MRATARRARHRKPRLLRSKHRVPRPPPYCRRSAGRVPTSTRSLRLISLSLGWFPLICLHPLAPVQHGGRRWVPWRATQDHRTSRNDAGTQKHRRKAIFSEFVGEAKWPGTLVGWGDGVPGRECGWQERGGIVLPSESNNSPALQRFLPVGKFSLARRSAQRAARVAIFRPDRGLREVGCAGYLDALTCGGCRGRQGRRRQRGAGRARRR